MLITPETHRTRPAPEDERNGDASADECPVGSAPHIDNDAAELMPWNVGECDLFIVAHPPVPVAPTYAIGMHLDNHTACGRGRIWYV